MSHQSEDRSTAAFERLAERSIAELRQAAELNAALRAERDDLAAQLTALRSQRLVRAGLRVSSVLAPLVRNRRSRDG